ncbi:MAG: YSC84-related protein [Gammaproteobacteria bacterium]
MNRQAFKTLIAVTGILLLVFSSATRADDEMHTDVLAAVALFKEKDPDMSKFFNDASGYVVFPHVGKGGMGFGGAHGKGEVFKGRKVIGDAKITQFTIGFQLGGQVFAEVIFFENETALTNFTKGKFEFSAQVSAIAAAAGVSADAKYEDGVAVFTMGLKGLMYEASVGGQKFKYKAR